LKKLLYGWRKTLNVQNSLMTCPFCEPTQRVLKENRLAFVLLSNPRRVEGHFLVIPKRHVENPINITDEEIVDLFKLVKFIQSKIIGVLGEGTRVQQNYMPFIENGRYKQSHMHYHVLPRRLEDRIYQLVDIHDTQLFEDLSKEEHNRVAKLLE
jgi:diadenosine tetraphosphate (Ap4A) HIT family hydrolase